MIIFGQECVEYAVTFTDTHNAAIPSTLDWYVTDSLLDGTDNTSIKTNVPNDEKIRHSYQSSGIKPVSIELDFDDGWGNIYQHQYSEDFEAIAYYVPAFDWTYTLDPFRINEEFVLTPVFDDARPNGEILHVSYNMDSDNKSTFDHTELNKLDTFTHSYPVKKTYTIQADVTYWDGWEYQTYSFYDAPRVANSPPVANYSLFESGICVTRLDLTDTATDPDGVDDIVDRYFELYKETDVPDTYALIHDENITYTGGIYSYQFALEGRYKVIYTVTDSESAQDVKETIYDIVFRECGDGAAGTGTMSGTINIQPGWQLVTIPTIRGYFDIAQGKIIKDKAVHATVKNYLIDQLAYKLNVPVEQMNQYIEVCIAYRGGELSQNFVVGVTPASSVNNFRLAYIDEENNKKEFTAFWVKNISGMTLPEISWEYLGG
jgi:hypothetical protein